MKIKINAPVQRGYYVAGSPVAPAVQHARGVDGGQGRDADVGPRERRGDVRAVPVAIAVRE